MANRLSENKRWNVLLLEAGRQETFITDVPLTASANSATSFNWGYRTDPNSQNACLGLEYVSLCKNTLSKIRRHGTMNDEVFSIIFKSNNFTKFSRRVYATGRKDEFSAERVY